MLKLYIGNKNYSSWSMRPWVLLKQAGIPFEEVMVRFDSFEPGSAFKAAANAVNPVGKVPALVDGDLAEGKIVCKFSTGGHSGVMVPVYAFGPGAEEFTGIFENTAIFDKIKKLLNL